MNQHDEGIYFKLSEKNKRSIDYLREDFNIDFTAAYHLLEDNDWNYEQAYRAMRSSRPDI